MSRWMTDTPASTRFGVYTRSNASDVLPDPISPLGASISWVDGVMQGWRDGNVNNGAFDMSELTAEGINPVCGFFNGFFYVNASVVRVFGERSGAGAAAIDAAFFGNRPDTPPYIAHPDDLNEGAATRLGAQVGWVLSATEWPHLDANKNRADDARAQRPNLVALSDAQLVERARSFTQVVREFFDDHVISSSNTAIGPAILGGIVPHLLLRLIAGVGDVDSAAPSQAMFDLSRMAPESPEFVAQFDEFLLQYGCRGPNEWDPYSEVWETKPALALALIDAMRAAGPSANPAVRAQAVISDREAATAEALAAVAGNEEATAMVIAAQASAMRFNAWRERTKTNCVKAVNEQRVALFELGRRQLGRDARDLFMLVDAELDAFIADPASFAPLIAERKAAWAVLWTLEPPYFIDSAHGVPALESLVVKGKGHLAPARSGDVLVGAGGCSGVVRGRARVILDISDPTALEPGDILVATSTDPSWTPLFVPAGGVVVNVGAMNSHAVIVSRELGIPCVVSVVDATLRIPDGAMVEVDGAAGTVTIL